MKNSLAHIIYSHHEYSDCWDPCIKHAQKFFLRHVEDRFHINNYLLLNEDTNRYPDYKAIIYDNSDSYTNRLLHTLKQIDEEYCLISHEDMILYNDIDQIYMTHCIDTISHDSAIDNIKLIRGGEHIHGSLYQGSEILYECTREFNFIFAIQPTLWAVQSLINLLEHNQGLSIWQFEVAGQSYCKQNNYLGLYIYTDRDYKRPTAAHYDSVVYPYIATAIIKGKWNLSQYKEELEYIFSEFGIDPKVRGTV